MTTPKIMTTPIEQLAFRPGRAANAPHVPADVTTTNAVFGPRAADVVNVRDYGAVGDGSTDDTAHIQAAFNDAFGMAQFTGVIGSGGSDNVLTVSSLVGTIYIGGYLSYNTGAAHGGVQITASLGGGQYTLSQHIGPITSRTMMSGGNQGDFNYPIRKVYIPAGNYRINNPLYIIGVLGAHVFGAGNGVSQLFFEGSATQGNIFSNDGYAPNSKWTPIIGLDGVAYSKFEMFDLGTFSSNADVGDIDVGTTNPIMTGIMAYQSGSMGTTSAIMFENINITNMFCGISGVGGGGNVENCILSNVSFLTCGGWGLNLTGQNVLNWQVYGGGASSCGWHSTFVPGANSGHAGAAYNINSGSLGCIYGVSCTSNQWDVFSFNGQQCHIAGGSSEGAPNTPITSITWSAGTATVVTAFPHKLLSNQPIAVYQTGVAAYNGYYSGTLVDTVTFTYPLAANPGSSSTGGYLSPQNAGTVGCVGGTVSIDGFAFRGGSSLAVMPIYASGIVIANGFNVDAGNDGGVGIISWLVNGAVSLNGATIAHFDSSSFKSTGACELRLENIQWIGRPTAPYSLFSGGTVREDDYFYNTTVSGLPTASAIFKGLRASVTDGAASLAWGATVTGGGSAFYEVVCNGSVWTVTGK